MLLTSAELSTGVHAQKCLLLPWYYFYDVFMALNNTRVTEDIGLRPSEASVTPGR